MFPDIPRERRRCYGFAPGAPCPAHDDGTWPDGCDCMKRLQDPSTDLVVPVAVTLVFAIVIICLIVWSIFGVNPAKGADNDQPCLTREQAKEKYPGQWLYWRTERRCWYGAHYAKPNRTHKGGKARTTPVLDVSGNEIVRVKAVRWNEYNELDAASDRDTFFNEIPATGWRSVPVPRSKFKPWDDRIGM